jgi:hypothetical protein
LNSGVKDRRARRTVACRCFFFIEHSRAFSRYPGCPPAGGKLTHGKRASAILRRSRVPAYWAPLLAIIAPTALGSRVLGTVIKEMS